MLFDWVETECIGGSLLASDLAPEYEIAKTDGKFFVRRLVAECDDIGPLEDFKQAEDLVFKIMISLSGYEEMLWKVIAAQTMKGLNTQIELPLLDGTASHETLS